MQVLRHIASLLSLCIRGPGGKAGIALYVVVLALELASVLVALRLIAWTKEFYDALQQMNGAESLRQIGIFGLIVLTEAVRNLSAAYMQKLLEIRWRRALTSQILDRWLGSKAYLHLKGSADGGVFDNPDQRIAEDCRIFLAGPATDHGTASGAIPLSLDVVTKVVGLFSYLSVLWGLSTFALDLSFLGIDAELPRYMVWMAFVYVALATGLTHLLGRPLKQLYFNQQRREADYRFALVRIRENADAIAMAGGEAAERTELDSRFGGIVGNWKRLIGRELILGSFTYPYRFTVLRIPTFLALPAYFASNVTFGGLMQLGSAFSQVVTTLSWFVFAYRPLAELAAASSRLGRFLEALDKHPQQAGIDVVARGADEGLDAKELSLDTPQGRRLLDLPRLAVGRGETVWLRGASGIGKTTLMKAFAGLWRHGSGQVAVPMSSSAFLPQQPYLPLGSLADAVAYPLRAADFGKDEIEAALVLSGFTPERIEALGDGPAEGLSGGERQRLALARLFLHRPDWVFLDEATSALDTKSEEEIMGRLRQALSGATFVIVSHRRPEGVGEVRTIDLSDHVPGAARTGAMEDA